jgi:outer membrane protein TolC
VATFPKLVTRSTGLRGLACLLAVFPSILAAAAPEIRFAEEYFPGLQELIERAALEATELQLGYLRLEERAGDLDVVTAQRRPNARLYGRVIGTYEMRDDIPDEFRGDLTGNLMITQPLYQWGNLKRRQAIAERRLDAEEAELSRIGAEQFMALRRAYLQWLLMVEEQAILEQSIPLSESFVDARRQLVEAGRSSEQDVLEMEARLLENKERLGRVEKAIRDLRIRLEAFTGEAVDFGTLEPPSLSVIEPMPEEALARLRREVRGMSLSGPLVRRWEILESIEAEQLDILDKHNWPQFDLVAGIFSDRLDAVNQDDSVLRMRYFAGVQVTWNIFDSWQAEGRKRGTLARKRAFALREEASRNDLARRAESLLADIELNLKQIEARGIRETLLERRVNLLREQAQRERVTGVDLIEGEIDYLEIRRRLMEARVDYLVNVMEIGILLDRDPAAKYYTPEP